MKTINEYRDAHNRLVELQNTMIRTRTHRKIYINGFDSENPFDYTNTYDELCDQIINLHSLIIALDSLDYDHLI